MDLQASAPQASAAAAVTVELPLPAPASAASPLESRRMRSQERAFQDAWLQILVDGTPGNATQLRQTTDAQFAPPASLTASQQSEADALTKRVLGAWRRHSKR